MQQRGQRLLEVWIDFDGPDLPSLKTSLLTVPRIGEQVAVKIEEPPRQDWIKLFPVVAVKHYSWPKPEIRVVLGKP
jgi:hypothetical protein